MLGRHEPIDLVMELSEGIDGFLLSMSLVVDEFCYEKNALIEEVVNHLCKEDILSPITTGKQINRKCKDALNNIKIDIQLEPDVRRKPSLPGHIRLRIRRLSIMVLFRLVSPTRLLLRPPLKILSFSTAIKLVSLLGHQQDSFVEYSQG